MFVCLREKEREAVAGAGANLPYLLLGYCGCLPRLCFLHATAVGRGAQGGEGWADIRHVVVVVDFGNHNCNCSLPKFMKCAVVDDDFATCPASASSVRLVCLSLCLPLSLPVCLSAASAAFELCSRRFAFRAFHSLLRFPFRFDFVAGIYHIAANEF